MPYIYDASKEAKVLIVKSQKKKAIPRSLMIVFINFLTKQMSILFHELKNDDKAIRNVVDKILEEKVADLSQQSPNVYAIAKLVCQLFNCDIAAFKQAVKIEERDEATLKAYVLAAASMVFLHLLTLSRKLGCEILAETARVFDKAFFADFPRLAPAQQVKAKEVITVIQEESEEETAAPAAGLSL